MNEKEKILCIKKKDLKLPLDGVILKFLPASNLPIFTEQIFLERNDELESNEDYLQIIPYTIIVSKLNHIFVYKRSSETQEGRLTGKYSFGVGGHLTDKDGNISKCIDRELKEEIGDTTSLSLSQDVFGLIYDSTNKVGRVHLGIAIKLEVEKLFSPSKNSEFHKNGTVYNWLQLDDIANTMEVSRLETWSSILYENYLKNITNKTQE